MVARLILSLASTLICVAGVDWCAKSLQCDHNTNTMCLFKSHSSIANFQSIQSIINPEVRKRVLAFHNRIREKVASGDFEGLDKASDMRQLTWSSALEESATRWAEQCRGNSTDSCRKIPLFPNVGQNVWTKCSPLRYPALSTIFDAFYSTKDGVTKKMIDVYERDIAPDGHKSHKLFTQIIWAETFRMGCGVVTYEIINSTSKDSSTRRLLCLAVVCNYAPAGNLVNSPVYIVGRPGRNCPDLTAVRQSILTGKSYSVYPSLCAYPSDPKSEFDILRNAQFTITSDTTVYSLLSLTFIKMLLSIYMNIYTSPCKL